MYTRAQHTTCRQLSPVHYPRKRGATPSPRSGAEAGRTPCPKGGSQEELPHVQGQGHWSRVPGCDGTGMAERSYPTSEVRGSSREELSRNQGAVDAWAQEGLEELSHVEGQKEWWLRGCRRAYRSYSTIKVRRGSGEEIPLVQCELCWSSREEISHVQGKRNPNKMVSVARGHPRADRLKP